MTTEEKYIQIEQRLNDAAAEERLAKRELDKLKPEKIAKEKECLETYGVPVSEINDKVAEMTLEYEILTDAIFQELEAIKLSESE